MGVVGVHWGSSDKGIPHHTYCNGVQVVELVVEQQAYAYKDSLGLYGSLDSGSIAWVLFES